MRGDFRAYGKVYRHLSPEQHAEAHSIALERHHALNWLCGLGRLVGRRPARHLIRESLLSPSMERIDRYADLIVRVGANVQPGQTLFVDGARRARRRSSARSRAPATAPAPRSSTSRYADQHLRRALIELGARGGAHGVARRGSLERAEALATGTR